MTSTLKTLLAAAALCCSALVSAQELKIGVVNLDRIMRDSAVAKAAQARLDAEFLKREKDLIEAETRLKTALDRFDKENPSLKESDRVRRQRELLDQDRELQRKRREYQEDVNHRKNEEWAAVVDRANRVLKQIFDQEKYDLIVQEAVFAGPRVDITDKVIKAMNAGSGK
jgi:outer membrane protein